MTKRREPRGIEGLAPAVAVLVAAALLVVSATGYLPDLLAPYFAARLAPLFVLVAVLTLVWVASARPGSRAVVVDVADIFAFAVCGWVALTAWLSLAPTLAWFGYYNRGAGAFFAIAVLVLFVGARRVLRGRRATAWLLATVAGVLALAAIVALAQAAGHDLWWKVAKNWPGRMTGTTGNPLNLAALALLGIWAGGLLAVREEDASRPARAAAWAAVIAGLVCNLLAVTRASYLGVAAGVVLICVWLAVAGRRKAAVTASLFLIVLAASAFVPVPDGSGGGRTLFGRVGGPDGGVTTLSDNDAKRVELWGEALDGLADRPLLGYGAGAFVTVDRLYRSDERRIRSPWNVASDAHSLPLLAGATSGVPGLLAGGALTAIVGIALGRRAWRQAGVSKEAARSGATHAAAAANVDGAGRPQALPALAYVVAAAAFLLVSPVDATVAVPLALLAGAGLGVPPVTARGWTIPAARSRHLGVAVTIAVEGIVGLTLVAAVYAGGRFVAADLAMGRYAAGADTAGASTAAERFRWEPLYALEAGGATWRAGVQGDDPARVEVGERFIRDGIALDPTGPVGYAELARLKIASGDPGAVPEIASEGLLHNPGHPILEGLWGYAAAVADADGDAALGRKLADALQSTRPESPDGWYWIARLREAQGDDAAARAASAAAERLAPGLGADDYQARLTRTR